MGKASRAKKDREPKRSREALLEHVAESRQFLEASAAAFDAGFDAEAKRLAVVLRVLVHHTPRSHSLLDQLGVKNRLQFLDTAAPIRPSNLLPTPGLVILRTSTSGDSAEGRYVAPLGDRPRPPREVAFAGWWHDPVMKVDETWSRKELVLSLANQEGGAHVDPSVNRRYESLAKENGLGWVSVVGNRAEPFIGNPVAVAVRQIAYEVSDTLERHRALLT